MVAAAAGLPDLVPVPVVRGADSGDLEHAPTADGVDDTCVLAVIRVVTSGECRCFRCLASLNRLNGRSPRVFVRPASAWLLLPSSAADTGDSAAAGLPKMPKNMKKLQELVSFRIFEDLHAKSSQVKFKMAVANPPPLVPIAGASDREGRSRRNWHLG